MMLCRTVSTVAVICFGKRIIYGNRRLVKQANMVGFPKLSKRISLKQGPLG
jgi:hypothetical protein